MIRDNSSNTNYDPNLDYRIIATADDAILAKHATAQAKYYRDPFCHAFCDPTTTASMNQHHPPRRHFQPIIKRGTHARVCCMDRALTAFLKIHAAKHTPQVQIVVLGAGKDTSYWRLVTKTLMGMEDYLLTNLSQPSHRSNKTSSSSTAVGLPPLPTVHWKEVDHPSVIHEKAAIIQRSKMLSQCCPNLQPVSSSSSASSSSYEGYLSVEGRYQLVGADLRESSHDEELLCQKWGLNPNLPTLILVECVFMYLPTHPHTKNLLQALVTTFSSGGCWMAMYEPILQDDAFGKMMEQNLVLKAQVATSESGLLQLTTLAQQLHFLVQEVGFARAVGCDMNQAYQSIVTPEQRKTANQAEFLDEMEEWTLIMKHYCFIMATTCRQSQDDPLTRVVMSGSSSSSSPLGFVAGKCEILSNQDEGEEISQE